MKPYGYESDDDLPKAKVITKTNWPDILICTALIVFITAIISSVAVLIIYFKHRWDLDRDNFNNKLYSSLPSTSSNPEITTCNGNITLHQNERVTVISDHGCLKLESVPEYVNYSPVLVK